MDEQLNHWEGNMMATTYIMDPADHIVSVDAAWIEFAEDNGAPALAERVVGQPLWKFIANPAVRELYRTLLRRVRATDRGVDLPFRCDSPSVQRFMSLSVQPDGNGPRGTLACRSSLLRETPQPRVALSLYAAIAAATAESWGGMTSGGDPIGDSSGDFGADAPRASSRALLSLCSWCKRLDVNGWCEIDEAVVRDASLFTEPIRPITHALCPSCESSVLAELT